MMYVQIKSDAKTTGAGDVYEISEALGKKLIKLGCVVEVESPLPLPDKEVKRCS
jgi:hypothetical protein